jgi:Flp pilus assembly protein TadG
MSTRCCLRRPACRRGAAAVELALLSPILAFLFVITVDYSRIFYYSLTIENAAELGAAYGCQSAANSVNTSGIQSAALADATNLSPNPTVSSAVTQDQNGNSQVAVTVTYSFKTITHYPGVPHTTSLSRTVSMRILPP